MNIFFVATCCNQAARAQCDKHVIKMLLEAVQLMYTAHHVEGTFDERHDCPHTPYRKTHQNHPMAQWARSCVQNYRWLHGHACALADEYTRRFGRVHGCEQHLAWLATPPETLSLCASHRALYPLRFPCRS